MATTVTIYRLCVDGDMEKVLVETIHRARHKLISGGGGYPPETTPPRLGTSLDTRPKTFYGEGAASPRPHLHSPLFSPAMFYT